MTDIRKRPVFLVHAVVAPLIAVFGGPLFSPIIASTLLVIWGAAFFPVFWFRGQQHRPAPLADGVSGSRLLFVDFYLLLAVLGRLGPWTAIVLAVGMEILDGIDGWIARRRGPTPFGGIWDMEIDAYVILVLSFTAVEYGSMPRWVLAIGLMRYFWFFPFLWWKPPGATFSPGLSIFSKTICVVTVIVLSVVWLYPAPFMRGLFLLNLVLLTASFVWEGLSYIAAHRRIQTRKR